MYSGLYFSYFGASFVNNIKVMLERCPSQMHKLEPRRFFESAHIIKISKAEKGEQFSRVAFNIKEEFAGNDSFEL